MHGTSAINTASLTMKMMAIVPNPMFNYAKKKIFWRFLVVLRISGPTTRHIRPSDRRGTVGF